MTLLDVVSKVSILDRVTVVKSTNGRSLIESKSAEAILDSRRFHQELASLEVCRLEVGDLCDLVITVE